MWIYKDIESQFNLEGQAESKISCIAKEEIIVKIQEKEYSSKYDTCHTVEYWSKEGKKRDWARLE